MLRLKTATGVLWNFILQLSTRGINILVTLLLARFLTPNDFGLVAMMALFIAIATSLMDSGFKDALIRKKNATQRDFSTAFYANLLLGLVSYSLLFAAAPFIADFYSEPILINLVRVAGLVIVINSFQLIQIASFSRDLNFKVQLKANIPASVISGIVAVTLAYFGLGVWSLIIQMILMSFLSTVFLWTMRLWRPTLGFCSRSLGEMFNFGYKLFLASLLDIFFRNLYIVIIAKFFTATIAGYYFFTERIKELLIDQLTKAIVIVTYPALSTIQDDNEQLKVAYRKIMLITTMMLFPAMVFLAALAEPLFEVLLPNHWGPAVPYLQFLCIAGIMYPINSVNLNSLKVKGRSDLFLYIEIIKKIMLVIILTISIQYGIYGILIGQIISSILAYIPNSYYSTRIINYSIKEQVMDFSPALFLSSLIASLIYILVSLSFLQPLYELIIYGLSAVITYLLVAYIMGFQGINIAFELVQNIKKQK